ncbi:hypothetical protein BdWA1_001120 [Babesia duncani]|uniref:Uncharacterized protein n=1 Tax=Babesia duncani TaxID=323732 RepID=A0AAD9UQN7_9APIC|nr:hypothetical protein BdWA1_001120 [Babesia duncani]
MVFSEDGRIRSLASCDVDIPDKHLLNDDNVNVNKPVSESWVILKVLCLLSSQDAKPLFDENDHPQNDLGKCPNVIISLEKITIPFTSHLLVSNAISKFIHIGSGSCALFKLYHFIENGYKTLRKNVNLKLPPSLSSLWERASAIKYKWNFDADAPGFFFAVKQILKDWRFIIFDLRKRHVRALRYEFQSTPMPQNDRCNRINSEDNLFQKKTDSPVSSSPLLQAYLDNVAFSDNKTTYTTQEPAFTLITLDVSLYPYYDALMVIVDFLEFVFNFMATRSNCKMSLQNAILSLLLDRWRIAVMTKNKHKLLWEFLITQTSGNECEPIHEIWPTGRSTCTNDYVKVKSVISWHYQISHLLIKNNGGNLRLEASPLYHQDRHFHNFQDGEPILELKLKCAHYARIVNGGPFLQVPSY